MSKKFWQDEAPASSKRERRKQEFREKIMDAAIQLFEKNGCDATTLEHICELAEVSRPTFYSYYPSKQDLIHALAQKLWMNVAGQLTELSLANQDSTQHYISSFFSMTLKDISQYNRLERELIRQSMAANASESTNMNMLYGLTSMFEAVYTAGRERGDVTKRFPADFLAEMTMGSISTVMMRWADDENYPIEKRLKQLGEYIPGLLE